VFERLIDQVRESRRTRQLPMGAPPQSPEVRR
jgi:hypothetical protein